MPNQKFLNALANVPQSTPPIWFMRQAGRYHSHYQNLKTKNSFEELCKSPTLAAETAMGPINSFDFDVADSQGKSISLKEFQNKPLTLIVNVASA